MKTVLLQLDTDEHPSPFDAIVANHRGPRRCSKSAAGRRHKLFKENAPWPLSIFAAPSLGKP